MWHPCKETHMPTTHKMPGRSNYWKQGWWIVIIECIYIYILPLAGSVCIYEYDSFLIDQLFLPWLHIRIIWGFLKIVWGWPRPQKFENWFWVNLLHSCGCGTPALDRAFLEGQDVCLCTPGVPCQNNCWLKLGTQCWKSPQRAAISEWKVHGLWRQKKSVFLPLNFAYLVAV